MYFPEIFFSHTTDQLSVACGDDAESFWVKYPWLKPSSTPVSVAGADSLTDCQDTCKSEFEACSAVDFVEDTWCKVYELDKLSRYQNVTAEVASDTLYLQLCLTGNTKAFTSTLNDARDVREVLRLCLYFINESLYVNKCFGYG